jgi:DNA-binding response OmpR family regulator
MRPGRTASTSREPRLAIVEDDEELREKIMLPALRLAGFDAVGLASALQLYRMWTGSPFDLVLLDVGLPDDDGVEIARHLRGLSPSIGIVMYTGHGRSVDRLRGLNAGVDAYLVKPLEMNEVIATLHNLHRRLASSGPPQGAGGNGWSLDHQGWRLLTPDGGTVALNQPERQVLAVLAAAPGEPVRRDALIAALTSDTDEFDPHRLEMLVYRLRRKCRETCRATLPLRAIRGVGYMLDW